MRCETCANSGKPGWVIRLVGSAFPQYDGDRRIVVCPECNGIGFASCCDPPAYPDTAREPHTAPE